jgi:hypothetical protein
MKHAVFLVGYTHPISGVDVGQYCLVRASCVPPVLHLWYERGFSQRQCIESIHQVCYKDYALSFVWANTTVCFSSVVTIRAWRYKKPLGHLVRHQPTPEPRLRILIPQPVSVVMMDYHKILSGVLGDARHEAWPFSG